MCRNNINFNQSQRTRRVQKMKFGMNVVLHAHQAVKILNPESVSKLVYNLNYTYDIEDTKDHLYSTILLEYSLL